MTLHPHILCAAARECRGSCGHGDCTNSTGPMAWLATGDRNEPNHSHHIWALHLC